MLRSTLALFLAAVVAVAISAAPAAASSPSSAPLIAGYWHDFLDHWTAVFQKQNGVVMGALAFGAVCLFIITRGKWKK